MAAHTDICWMLMQLFTFTPLLVHSQTSCLQQPTDCTTGSSRHAGCTVTRRNTQKLLRSTNLVSFNVKQPPPLAHVYNLVTRQTPTCNVCYRQCSSSLYVLDCLRQLVTWACTMSLWIFSESSPLRHLLGLGLALCPRCFKRAVSYSATFLSSCRLHSLPSVSSPCA